MSAHAWRQSREKLKVWSKRIEFLCLCEARQRRVKCEMNNVSNQIWHSTRYVHETLRAFVKGAWDDDTIMIFLTFDIFCVWNIWSDSANHNVNKRLIMPHFQNEMKMCNYGIIWWTDRLVRQWCNSYSSNRFVWTRVKMEWELMKAFNRKSSKLFVFNDECDSLFFKGQSQMQIDLWCDKIICVCREKSWAFGDFLILFSF